MYKDSTRLPFDTGNASVTITEVRDACKAGKISLIKLYRACTGAGLKDSKDAIESVGGAPTENMMIEFFISKSQLVTTLSKAEVMEIVSTALDQANVFHFSDPFDAIQLLCENIKKAGGAERIAQGYQAFINSI
jgi:hypothetical protein